MVAFSLPSSQAGLVGVSPPKAGMSQGGQVL